MADENIIQKMSEDDFSGKIRRAFNVDEQQWYFSVVDLVGVLVDKQTRREASDYWKNLKQRREKEGIQLVSFCHQLKLQAEDGKLYKTDVANMENILRIVQEIPSPKVEPVKQWLAKVGQERLDEEKDPEKSIERAIDNYKKQGKSIEWIVTRLQGKGDRLHLTTEWRERGIEGNEFAHLTNTMYGILYDTNAKGLRKIKGLDDKESLRDNKSRIELALDSLAEISTIEIMQNNNSQGYIECNTATKDGSKIARDARNALEEKLGRSIIVTKTQLKSGYE